MLPETKNLNEDEPFISIIPLGGLGEIGKNMMVIESSDDILVIDAGLKFPDEEMLGVDLVIPDITYLTDNRDRIRGVVLTHGHEDHMGAIPYLVRSLDVPIYGTKLTLGMVRSRLSEFDYSFDISLNPIEPGDVISLGNLQVEAIQIAHSIVDGVALAVRTPAGTVVHTGDFKIDQSPANGRSLDFQRFAELGREGVTVFMSDSTNADREGYSRSEIEVLRSFDEVFAKVEGRIIIATFSSNIHRIQQIIDVATKHRKCILVIGMSMAKNIRIASELGYLKTPTGTFLEPGQLNKCRPEDLVVITTGSQGEPMSGLTRMAMGVDKTIKIKPGDTVIISARTIPGNEKAIAATINNLFRRGSEVIYEQASEVHASGHASQEELKLMLNLIRPKFFVPIHGEYRHLIYHSRLAEEVGMRPDNIFIIENGEVLEITPDSVVRAGSVRAGKVLVDGKGVGDVGTIVLRDRQHLSQDGFLIVVVTLDSQTGGIVSGPEVISRGFVYVRESGELLEEARELVEDVLNECEQEKNNEWGAIKSSVKAALATFLFEETERRPMILPIIMEV